MNKTKIFLWLAGVSILIFNPLSSMNPDTGQNPVNGKIKPLQNEVVLNQSAEALKILPGFGKIPLSFIQNQGQVNERAIFYARTSRYTLWMTKEGLVFDSLRKIADSKYERDVSQMTFLNANNDPEVVALDPKEHRVNHFIGNDSNKWRQDIPTFQAVLYKEIYKNIDLKIYGVENQVEYDWVVKPGGDPGQIQFEYKNMGGIKLDGEGNLRIDTGFVEFIHRRPESYQRSDDSVQPVEARFRNIAKNVWGFEVSPYERTRELIIDPFVVAYSSYLGGSGWEDAQGIAIDKTGAVFIAAGTGSADFPITNPLQEIFNNGDCFITKISPSGTSLIWSTFLGGGDGDVVDNLALDSSGNVYITGNTSSTDFPLKNPFQKKYGGGNFDVYIAKISSDGNSLIYSTYLGGNDCDLVGDIAVDKAGAAYITGSTFSHDFPSDNPVTGWLVYFLTKFEPDGNALAWSKTGDGGGAGVAVDNKNAVYMTGYKGRDAFVAKYRSSDGIAVWETSFGGSSDQCGNAIAVAAKGIVYVAGWTFSRDFPLSNPAQKAYGGGEQDGFVTKFASDGKTLIWSTYLGGNSFDSCKDIVVDPNGEAYVVGTTDSPDFPLKKPLQNYSALTEAFITKFAKSGKRIDSSTYLGGSLEDCGAAVALDEFGAVYVTGGTDSPDFSPLKSPFQSELIWSHDCFFTKMGMRKRLVAPAMSSPQNGATGQPQTLKLRWEDTNNYPQEANYVVRIKLAGGKYQYYTRTSNAKTCKIAKLLTGKTYLWNVRANGSSPITKNSKWASAKDWEFTTK